VSSSPASLPQAARGCPRRAAARRPPSSPLCLAVARVGGQKPDTSKKGRGTAAGHLGREGAVPCGRWRRSSPTAPGAPSTLHRSDPRPLVADPVPPRKDLWGVVRCVGEQMQQALWRRRLQVGGAEVRRSWRACRTWWCTSHDAGRQAE
jgi:hypothetical protein